MTINFELLEVSKMNSLKIYKSPVTEKLEKSSLLSAAGKPYSKGSIGYSRGSDVIISYVTFTSIFISSYRGATVIKFGQ